MRDIPVFTTENGAASLTLQEIPYTGRAYVRVQASESLPGLIGECVVFCKMAGAEKIYAMGHPGLEPYSLHTAVVKMTCLRQALADTDACLFPVTEQTLEHWRKLYNERMADVPNAAWLTEAGAKQMLQTGDGYFVHRDGQLLGIGRASYDRIDAVVSARPGAGETVVLALAHALTSDVVTLEVATANTRAVRLYERLGFIAVEEISRWYEVE